MAATDIVYRAGRLEDVQAVFEATYAQDWPVSYEFEADIFHSCPEAFIVAEHDGKAIGHAMGDAVSDDEAFVCILIVDDAYQKRGTGGKLFGKCVAALGDRNVTLFASAVGAPFYKKHFGFKPEENPLIVSMGLMKPQKSALKEMKPMNPSLKQVSLKDVPIEQLLDYNKKNHFIVRRNHLEKLRNLENTAVLLTADGVLVGYGCLRHLADVTYIIGPVCADSPEYAENMVKALVEKLPDECKLFMLSFKSNTKALDIMRRLGTTDFPPMEMLYTKHQLKLSVEHLVFLDNVGNLFG